MVPTYTNDRTPNRRYGCSDTSKFLNLHTGSGKRKKVGKEEERREEERWEEERWEEEQQQGWGV